MHRNSWPLSLTNSPPRKGLLRFSIFEIPDGAFPYSLNNRMSKKEEWGAITVTGASDGRANFPFIFTLWKPRANNIERTIMGRKSFIHLIFQGEMTFTLMRFIIINFKKWVCSIKIIPYMCSHSIKEHGISS